MDDLPQPPSPQIVMEMGTGGCVGVVMTGQVLEEATFRVL